MTPAGARPVHWWPASLTPAPDGVLVIGVESGERSTARAHIRTALRAALERLLDAPAEAVAIVSGEGRAPAISVRGCAATAPGLSISHDAPWSLAAINLNGPVGIDVMRVQDIPDWRAVAQDYLGPEVTARLATLPAAQRAAAFARAWSAHEARLKCLGLGLAEWTPALAESLAACVVLPLALPDSHAGTLALPKPACPALRTV
jgi:4'-phosphopantetheinyl transferase